MSNGIIVLGMHRSGTSLIAELVHRWGAFGRVKECLPSNQWNARGYWELAPLVDFNRRLLREVGANWSFPPSQKQDLYLAELADRPAYRAEAMRLLASMEWEGDSDWFWKDPRLSILLPFWQKLWGDARYIICIRDPLEICRSLHERDELSFSISMMLWHRYMLSILEWTRKRPAIVMSYSRVLRNPEQECQRLATFLAGRDGYSDAAQAASEMRKAIDRELRHCKANVWHKSGLLTRRQQNLQDTLENLADQGHAAGVNLTGCALPMGWRTLLRGDLLLLRCQQRWNRMFPGVRVVSGEESKVEALAVSYARGLELLQVNTQFSNHNGLLLAAVLKQIYSESGERGEGDGTS